LREAKLAYSDICLQVECSNPSELPEPGKRRAIEEPYIKVSFCPIEKPYPGTVIIDRLCVL
jgi:translation elongation factor EF-4